jgi:DNA-binding transcriptional MerR regulator
MELTSKQLSDLVGVTVRTLRYYHQIGLTPEPERTWGGYRIYTEDDVLRLLRIRRLAGLGLPLESVATILDNPDDPAARRILLERDREFADQIAKLKAQRKAIAAMLAADAPVDVLPEFARHIAALESLGAVPGTVEEQKMIIDVVAGLGSEEDIKNLEELLSAVDAQTGSHRELWELDQALSEIGPDATDAEVESLVQRLSDAIIAFFEDYLKTHGTFTWSSEAPLDELIGNLGGAWFNGRQREVLEQVEARVVAHTQTLQP